MSRPRGPGVTHTVLALVLIVLLASFTLSAREPPPPSIAEFAPQAVEQIRDAPTGQSSSNGRAGGAGAGDVRTQVSSDAQPQSTVVPRVRRCVGDPPRQIEDPQSPPCVPYWAGDNGGGTYKGVTRDEIRIVAPEGTDTALEAFFNKRFEFYGRKIRLMDGSLAGGQAGGDERADATKFDEEFRVFASLHRWYGGTWVYYNELARRGLIGVTMKPKWSESYARTKRPYLWQYPIQWDAMFAGVGEWACARLAGRPAAYAGPDLDGKRRVFGVIFHREDTAEEIDTKPLQNALRACGENVLITVSGVGGDQISPATANNAMLQMRQAGVTTIVCLCHGYGGKTVYGSAATDQGYFPEWVMTSYIHEESNMLEKASGFAPEQRVHLMGLTFRPKQVRPENWPPRWASVEGGGDGNASASIYRSLLLIASGIQMAGPRLTPETFEQGLQRTVFPNPDTPIMAGHVGFQSDWSMTDDAAEIWWSETASDPTAADPNAVGAFCYVGGGVRYRHGAWPVGEGQLFRPPCDSGAA